ncbi:hypothetical protein HYH03_005915 [Edaphochlamys debaryana]|uniref:F5/8 type C domain-containing protein n=1 Tax=Edaphochlamys debaryana TaxID=47281 RepID=A0A835Y4T2_9CHLO|nr:hypothetical protein HYH03_005915 [Edaphochlamys debaryana]|eukprot:KAG2495991.1 hypothetical protein HYH03_005915 [Edaphochlamys debaryana]
MFSNVSAPVAAPYFDWHPCAGLYVRNASCMSNWAWIRAPVYASSLASVPEWCGDVCAPSNLVDGDTTLRWTHSAEGDLTPWVSLDLGLRVAVARVVIYNRPYGYGSRLRNAELRIGDSPVNRTGADVAANPLVWKQNFTATDGQVITVYAGDAQGRWVSLQNFNPVPPGSGAYYLHVAEVQVFGEAVPVCYSHPDFTFLKWKDGQPVRELGPGSVYECLANCSCRGFNTDSASAPVASQPLSTASLARAATASQPPLASPLPGASQAAKPSSASQPLSTTPFPGTSKAAQPSSASQPLSTTSFPGTSQATQPSSASQPLSATSFPGTSQATQPSSASQPLSATSFPGTSQATQPSSASQPLSTTPFPGTSQATQPSSASQPRSTTTLPGTSQATQPSSASQPLSATSFPGTSKAAEPSFASQPRSTTPLPGTSKAAEPSFASQPRSTTTLPGTSKAAQPSSAPQPLSATSFPGTSEAARPSSASQPLSAIPLTNTARHTATLPAGYMPPPPPPDVPPPPPPDMPPPPLPDAGGSFLKAALPAEDPEEAAIDGDAGLRPQAERTGDGESALGENPSPRRDGTSNQSGGTNAAWPAGLIVGVAVGAAVAAIAAAAVGMALWWRARGAGARVAPGF